MSPKVWERYVYRRREVADGNHNHANERMLFHGRRHVAVPSLPPIWELLYSPSLPPTSPPFLPFPPNSLTFPPFLFPVQAQLNEGRVESKSRLPELHTKEFYNNLSLPLTLGSPFISYIIQNGFDERHAYIGGMFGAGK